MEASKKKKVAVVSGPKKRLVQATERNLELF